jgi:outer membrane protein assembly factor BamC
MLRVVFLLLLVSLTGCSTLFGDTFNDEAKGYQKAKVAPPMKQLDGKPALSIQDMLVIPPLGVKPQVNTDANDSSKEDPDKEFIVPKPQQLLALENEQKQEVASLVQRQSEALNPRLERDGAGTQVLRLDGRFDYAWAAIADAIGKTDYTLSDLNRSTGTYYISIFDPEAEKKEKSFWAWLTNADELGENIDYLLKLHRSRIGVYLSLQSDAETLADDALSKNVLSDIEKNLTK